MRILKLGRIHLQRGAAELQKGRMASIVWREMPEGVEGIGV